MRFLVLALLTAAAGLAAVQALAVEYTPPPADPPPYQNPVMAGDFPDPTATRVGPEYWAIATASGGQKSPPILRSPDLVHWTVAGNLFVDPPAWSSGRQLWGPWLVRDGDQYRVYYSARKKYGRPCVTVGVADNPIGPYTDLGPLVCQPNASIDPSVVHNQNGAPFLLWKENGGSDPSSIWVQGLARDGLSLTGPRRKIMVGSGHSWEGGLVEGPRMIRRHGWLYLFYSGGRCCAPSTCKYALGVARSKSIYGPWRRYKRNPVLKNTRDWICPGHGAVLQPPSGHWWLLYNGYRAHGPSNRGREMLLDMIHWTRDAWPFFTPGSRPQTATGTTPQSTDGGGAAPAQ